MDLQRDPVTQSVISPEEQQQDKISWEARAADFVARCEQSDPLVLCQALYQFLDQESRGQLGRRPTMPLCDHAPDSYLADHALLTSAIVYCLGHDHSDLHLLRLAALSHELPEQVRTMLKSKLNQSEPRHISFLEHAWRMLQQQTNALLDAYDSSAIDTFQDQPSDETLVILWYAHLTAAQPLFNQKLPLPDGAEVRVVEKCADFAMHPLAKVSQEPAAATYKVRLIHGGATKIKSYVFESAKLPELRGASALLDRLNQVDSRHFFSEAPECVIYANGGDLLALAPVVTSRQLADQLEQRYAQETLTAQAVFVDDTYTLLELQYGLRPTQFWADHYQALVEGATPAQQQIMHAYYGDPQQYNAQQHNAQQPQTEARWTDAMLFHLRKGFGECTTQLALKRTWRRDGNTNGRREPEGRAARRLPHFETIPFSQYCTSCDRRMAVVRVPDLNDALCEPCMRKRWTGWYMRHEEKKESQIFASLTEWQPTAIETDRQNANQAEVFRPWHRQFEGYLNSVDGELAARYWQAMRKAISGWVDMPDNLDQISQAAKPEGYIGLVYADGNNVGALIEKIRTAGFYRQFASRLFCATQTAVFDALATHLKATEVQDEQGEPLTIHPFEIINIGGDDLFLIVPAQSALPIAQHIAAYIEGVFSDGESTYQPQAQAVQRYRPTTDLPSGRPRISMAAGVVLADCHLPIFFLQDLVEELLKSAKKGAKTRKQQGYWGGMIDFMSMKSTGMVASQIKDFRAAALTQDLPDRNERLHLTARPYTTHEVAGLLATVAALQQAAFPRTQLHLLRELLPQGRFVSSLSYLYYSSRLRGRRTENPNTTDDRERAVIYQAQLRSNFDQAWHVPTKDPVPWRWQAGHSDDQQHWETVLADLIELYDFAPQPATETEAERG